MKKLDFVRMRIEFKMKGRFQSFLSSFLSKTTWIFLKLFYRLQGNFLKTPWNAASIFQVAW